MNIHNLITTENVALLSVIITLLIFILSRQAEVRYKKHEDKKNQYIKLINLMNKSMKKGVFEQNSQGEIIPTNEQRDEFFDVGSSLLLYGSTGIYRKYVFLENLQLIHRLNVVDIIKII
ncbi:hypothetical protein [Pseudobutyrivibrio ruminis]|uniref:Uncharacterized protein n=1 Tax=Pseudobutyrivibrio ruminis TaxID=46206 RepID=A0A2G3DT82_9FIRM|nr:hypothetical protein [Pseudobutyrivibrio ruminis]PHU34247.1 hypothetical protein CSX01_11825 [Pseudobutyrivibrio ruminis]